MSPEESSQIQKVFMRTGKGGRGGGGRGEGAHAKLFHVYLNQGKVCFKNQNINLFF